MTDKTCIALFDYKGEGGVKRNIGFSLGIGNAPGNASLFSYLLPEEAPAAVAAVPATPQLPVTLDLFLGQVVPELDPRLI